jgi:mannose-6-phosphate isomerase-like protein (cupin superfamily)
MMSVVRMSREAMLKRIATFARLIGKDNSFPEFGVPGYARTMYNIVGFRKPTGQTIASKVVISPVGETAPVIEGPAGFGLLYLECMPGNGVPNHNHDTNETFAVISGRWLFHWGETVEQDKPENQAELGPLDVISYPAGVLRRFENIEGRARNEPGMLLGVIAGDAPSAEYTEDFNDKLRALGILPARPAPAVR